MKETISLVLERNPKVNTNEQGNKVKAVKIGELHNELEDGLVKGDIIRIWNKEGLLIATFVIN